MTPSEALQKLATNGDDVDAEMLGRLTAHLPRDVVTSAIREWMPALEVEIAEHQPVRAARCNHSEGVDRRHIPDLDFGNQPYP